MTLPSSPGRISISQISQIINNSTTALLRVAGSEPRLLSNRPFANTIPMSAFWGKPTSGCIPYGAGPQSFLVVPYQYLTVTLKGGGTGGSGGTGCSTCSCTCTCCCVPGYGGGWYPYSCGCACCVNCGGGVAGNVGGQTSFNGLIAYGGTWGAAGGNNQNATKGGGGAGGAGGSAYGCCGSAGSTGYAGGAITYVWTKTVGSAPVWATTINFNVGYGGTGGANAGGTGGNGSALICYA